MAADYKRIHRLLHIYTLIQGNQAWTAGRLSQECKTTERTIFRDIDVLRGVGVPVFHDTERKCYLIQRDYFMPPLELTFDESLALVSLGRHTHDGQQIPFSNPALKALAKIRGQLPRAILNDLDLVEEHIAVKLAASATQEGFTDCYNTARQAIAQRTCLRCRYESPQHAVTEGITKEATHFQFKPYALFFSQRAWYVVGFHGARGEVRTLKLNRFAEMTPTDIRFQIPKDFALDKHLGNAWRMIRGAKSFDVSILFDKDFTETISDTAWHATQTFEHQPDGALLWKCTVDGLDEILWWVLSMGCHCTVLQPPELAERVLAEATRMTALYANPTTDAANAKSRVPTAKI